VCPSMGVVKGSEGGNCPVVEINMMLVWICTRGNLDNGIA
jgi:hypothetical protein